MFDRWSRSWELVKQSWQILLKDRELLVFPLLSTLATLGLIATFVVPFCLLQAGAPRPQPHSLDPVWYGVGFLYYLGMFFIAYFFNIAIMQCAAIRMDGGNPTVTDGLNGALARAPKILAWAAISATVGIVLRLAEERVGFLGRLVVSLFGAAFTLVTSFTVPVLVFEELSVTDSARRAVDLLKKNWGESVIAQTGIGLVFGWLTVPGVLLMAAAGWVVAQGHSVGIGLLIGSMGFLYIIVLSLIGATMTSIFRVALYRYATQKPLGGYYAPELLAQHFAPRRA